MAKETTKMITANRLRDGAVIFLNVSGEWTEQTAGAAVAHTAEDEQTLLNLAAASVKACLVVDPVAIDVSPTHTTTPSRLRERIRQIGPTVRPDLARTA